MRTIVPPDEGSYSYDGMGYTNPDAVTQIANGLSTTTRLELLRLAPEFGDFAAGCGARCVAGKPALARLQELLRPAVIQALGNALAAAQLGDRAFAALAVKDTASHGRAPVAPEAVCGGRDRFAGNVRKQIFNSRSFNCSTTAPSPIGVPHIDFGEGVVAVVTPKPGASLEEKAIQAALSNELAKFKQPKRVIITTGLPRNAMGTVQKKQAARSIRQRLCGMNH